ncbi:hypothetical protein Unana1_07769 [Umbelopsis nana]
MAYSGYVFLSILIQIRSLYLLVTDKDDKKVKVFQSNDSAATWSELVSSVDPRTEKGSSRLGTSKFFTCKGSFGIFIPGDTLAVTVSKQPAPSKKARTTDININAGERFSYIGNTIERDGAVLIGAVGKKDFAVMLEYVDDKTWAFSSRFCFGITTQMFDIVLPTPQTGQSKPNPIFCVMDRKGSAGLATVQTRPTWMQDAVISKKSLLNLLLPGAHDATSAAFSLTE